MDYLLNHLLDDDNARHEPIKRQKQHRHVCDECEKTFKCNAYESVCLVCEMQVCGKCSKYHCLINGGKICIRASYNFRTDSIKRLQNWPYDNIQLCCPICNEFKIEKISEIKPLNYICSNPYCTPEKTPKTCYKPNAQYYPFLDYQEGNNDIETLYRRVPHRITCNICYKYKCPCIVHYCHVLNISRFYPRIAYAYNKNVRKKILTILCIFKYKLKGIHRDIVWKYVINYLDWQIKPK